MPTSDANNSGGAPITVEFARPDSERGAPTSDAAPNSGNAPITVEFARSDPELGTPITDRTPRSSESDISVTFAERNPEIPPPVGEVGAAVPAARTAPPPTKKTVPSTPKKRPAKSFLSILRCRISTYHGKKGRRLAQTIADTTKDIVGLASGGGVGVLTYWGGKLIPATAEWGASKLGYEHSKEIGDLTSSLIEGVLSAKTLRNPEGVREAIEGFYGAAKSSKDAADAVEKITGGVLNDTVGARSSDAPSAESPERENADPERADTTSVGIDTGEVASPGAISPRVGDTL